MKEIIELMTDQHHTLTMKFRLEIDRPCHNCNFGWFRTSHTSHFLSQLFVPPLAVPLRSVHGASAAFWAAGVAIAVFDPRAAAVGHAAGPSELGDHDHRDKADPEADRRLVEQEKLLVDRRGTEL